MDTKKALLAIAVIAILGFAGMQILEKRTQSGGAITTEQTAETGSNTNADTMTLTGTPETTQATYKNGTYSAIGTYQSPAGKEEIDIKLTITDGIVTDTEFTGKAVHQTSKKNAGALC
ncbi:MAG: hypothetical protein UZ21_OP11001000227 [Microgenomates bacterium OLB22]|nr:MAG: hypothetical protein UZ21_OP11001000227 [Microgenomates bacterium OLB22]